MLFLPFLDTPTYYASNIRKFRAREIGITGTR